MPTNMDPHNLPGQHSPTEYSWGPGLFPPGIADGEGQTKQQYDFGERLGRVRTKPIGDARDNYARAVADRRTDPLDADSNRDFETLGNPDRFGPAPPLVRAKPVKSDSTLPPIKPQKLTRKW